MIISKLNTLVVATIYALISVLSSAAQDVVPIEKEPMHRLKFENQYVRVFDVLIPVGKASLFHTHVYDGVGVRVSNARMNEEFPGGGEKAFVSEWGTASFGTGPPFSHRVVNVGTSDFRNIYIELLRLNETEKPQKLPILSDGHVILLENTRVRVNRLVLKPGESSGPHTHARNGIGVIVHDADIEITSTTGSPRSLHAKAGDFVWQPGGTTHTIKNIGTTVFEAIDIELK